MNFNPLSSSSQSIFELHNFSILAYHVMLFINMFLESIKVYNLNLLGRILGTFQRWKQQEISVKYCRVCARARKFGCCARVLETTKTEAEVRASA